MNEAEYLAAFFACHNGESYYGDSADWNKDYRSKLEKHGLILTYTEPKESWVMMAPIPTPQDVEGIVPHTPETDPFAWYMPAWIVSKA